MVFRNILSLALISGLLLSCDANPIAISVDNKALGIHYVNLDSMFVKTAAENLSADLRKSPLMEEQILAYELGYCLKIGDLRDPLTPGSIKTFVEDPFIARVEKRIGEKFGSLAEREQKINHAFSYLNYHFPKGKIPKNVVFLNSCFQSSVFCTENEIGIGLERYLGDKTDVIKELPPQDFFPWIKEGWSDMFLERDVLTAWIMTHYVPESKQNTADAIVNWGKIIYLTEASFPEAEKNIIIRYTKEDYDWALKNEYAFWKYLVDEKLLFSDSERDQANFLNDAPFTVGLPEKGPDRLGQFLGWRMVQSYMANYPETSLEELLKLPYNKILQEYEVE